MTKEALQEKLQSYLSSCSTLPFLFIGSGFSQRYLKLENWEELLRLFATNGDSSSMVFEKYAYKAKEETKSGNHFPLIASLINKDFTNYYLDNDEYKISRQNNAQLIRDSVPPLKIAVAEHFIKKESEFENCLLVEELELLKKAGKKSLSGIITTNYDTFLEKYVFLKYRTFIGQEELLFSNPQGVGEIYKIHGCCTDASSIVLTAEDYEKFEQKAKYLASKLLTIFMEHPIIFMGYSINDDNILSILSSIAECIPANKLDELKKRFFFIEWNNTESDDDIQTHRESFGEGKRIEMVKVSLKNFNRLYEVLLRNKNQYNTSLLRRLKEDVYELVTSNDPKGKLHVLPFNEDVDGDDIQYVMGVGAEIGRIGYGTIKPEEILKDIILDDQNYNKKSILENCIEEIIRNQKEFPCFKYLSTTVPIDAVKCPKIHAYVESHINFDAFLSNTIKKKKANHSRNWESIEEIVTTHGVETLTSYKKILQDIVLLDEEQIEIEDLSGLLRDVFKEYPAVFEGKDSIRTDLRRVIKIYDWLKYGKENAQLL